MINVNSENITFIAKDMKLLSKVVIISLIFFCLICIPLPLQQTMAYNPVATVDITINDIDWEKQRAYVQVYATIQHLPFNFSYLNFDIKNSYSGHRGGYMSISLDLFKPGSPFSYFGNETDTLTLYGNPVFHPYDDYFLNLTLMIDNPNTTLLQDDFRFDVGLYNPKFSHEEQATFNLGENTEINLQIYLRRIPWRYDVRYYLIIGAYGLLSCIFAIPPDKLSTRLSIAFTLIGLTIGLLYNSSFQYLEFLPTYLVNTIFTVLFGTMLFSIRSVFEYVRLIEKQKQPSLLTQIVMMSIITFSLIVTHIQMALVSQSYFWINIPFDFLLFIILFKWLMFYGGRIRLYRRYDSRKSTTFS